jgi:hypothetical protein
MPSKPFQAIIINLLLLFFVFSFYCYFKIRHPKKKTPWFAFLLALSVIPVISIFRKGTYESGDLTINAIKLISFYNSLREGIFIPRWAGNLNATYGYPNFIFAYPLPYYVGSFFHFVGFSYLNSIKLLLASSFVLSGFAMYFFLKTFSAKRAAFLGSILYLYAPYHLLDMHYRANIGEMLAFVFLPLAFLTTTKYLGKLCLNRLFFSALSITFLVLSHQAVSLLAFALLFLFILVTRNTKSLKKFHAVNFFPLVLGLLFSAYYWLPALLEAKYTQQIFLIIKPIIFPSFADLIYSPWKWGLLFQGPEGQLSPIIGYAHLVAVIATIIILVKNKVDKDKNKMLIFFSAAFIVYFLLMQKVSLPVWQVFTFLKKIQFPFRILSIIIFIISTISALVVDSIKSRLLFITLLSLSIFPVILNLGNRKMLPKIGDQQLIDHLPASTALVEGLKPAASIWTPKDSPWQEKVPKKNIEAITGNILVLNEIRSSTKHSYIIKANTNSLIKENTLYFPGWKLKINGLTSTIDFQNPRFPGIVTFNLERGIHQVELKFADTSGRKVAFYITCLSLTICGSLLIGINLVQTLDPTIY